MQIGNFRKTRHGFEGRVHTLGLDLPFVIVPAESSDSENAPDWRIHLGENEIGPEAGAGWDRTGDKAGRYVSMLIDCPTLPQPIRARLFKSDQHEEVHHLVWTRSQPQSERAG
jgi:uncharacterized protein (DUF736 family)